MVTSERAPHLISHHLYRREKSGVYHEVIRRLKDQSPKPMSLEEIEELKGNSQTYPQLSPKEQKDRANAFSSGISDFQEEPNGNVYTLHSLGLRVWLNPDDIKETVYIPVVEETDRQYMGADYLFLLNTFKPSKRPHILTGILPPTASRLFKLFAFVPEYHDVSFDEIETAVRGYQRLPGDNSVYINACTTQLSLLNDHLDEVGSEIRLKSRREIGYYWTRNVPENFSLGT